MLQSMGSQSQTQLSDWTEPRVKPKSSLLPARPYEIEGCCLLTLFPHSPLASKSHLQSFGTHKLESTQELLQLLTSLLKSFSPNSSPDVKWRGLLPLSFFFCIPQMLEAQPLLTWGVEITGALRSTLRFSYTAPRPRVAHTKGRGRDAIMS